MCAGAKVSQNEGEEAEKICSQDQPHKINPESEQVAGVVWKQVNISLAEVPLNSELCSSDMTQRAVAQGRFFFVDGLLPEWMNYEQYDVILLKFRKS